MSYLEADYDDDNNRYNSYCEIVQVGLSSVKSSFRITACRIPCVPYQ